MRKPIKQFLLAAALLACANAARCADAEAKPDAVPQIKNVKGEIVVTLDAETQKRIGLEIANLTAVEWQPEVKGYGHVMAPATLTAAVADLESARSTAEVSTKEYERLKSLGDNVSARVLETAKSAATHDQLVFEAALAKFKLDWGQSLAEGNDREKVVAEIVNGQAAFVRIDLPAGEALSSQPVSARIVELADETKSVSGEFSGATDGVNPQTQSRSYFFLVKGQPLTLGSAVTGFLKISGDKTSGAIVPASAVLRHVGRGWIYLQTAATDFTRRELPLDRAADGGFFSGKLSATNRVVVVGAQTILSTELSSGGFNTGERD
jgi:hypothetical protein